MKKWTYELNITEDIWRGGIFNTKEEAIKEANLEAIIDNIEEFKVGIIEYPRDVGIDVDDIFEQINIEMCDKVGEIAEDYLLNVDKNYKKELSEKLNKVLFDWKDKYNYNPIFYKVISEEIIKVK